MQIGFSFLMWTPELREEHLPLLGVLKEMGYDGVELPVVATKDDVLVGFARACDDLDLGRTAVGFATPEANPVSCDSTVRTRARAHLSELVRKTALLGAETLAGPLHSAYAEFTGTGPTEEELERCAQVLRGAADVAAEAGVQLGLEYLNRFECYLVTTAAETDSLVRRIAHVAIASVLDTHHSHIEDPDVGQALRTCAGTLGHVQLSESHRGHLGHGQVHWPRVFDALRSIDYDGWLVVESFSRNDPTFAGGLHVWRDPAENLLDIPREALSFVRKNLR